MTDKRSHEFTSGLYWWITHTDFASTDAARLGSGVPRPSVGRSLASFPTPNGDFHLFAYSQAGGGGSRRIGADQSPGSTSTVHVEDTQAVYDAALAAGADAVTPPTKIMEGVCTAMVRAPGGVLIGSSGPTS